MKYSDLLLVTSGTATLEALCFGAPMIVLYKTGWLNYAYIYTHHGTVCHVTS